MIDFIKTRIKQLIGFFTKTCNGPYTEALLINSRNGLFLVDQKDITVGWKLRRKGVYGAEELERYTSSISSESRVLIVGAHIGTLAIPLSRIAKEVVAIEANPHTFDLLKKNISLNHLTNCTPHIIAASDKEETISFLIHKTNSGGSKRVPVNKDQKYYYDHPEEVKVQAFSLDSYLPDHHFDLIIMDIEGSEYFALKGMQNILSKTKILAIEFLPHHLKNVSGVSVEQFLSTITPHFSKLIIPSSTTSISANDFLPVLTAMYNRNQEEDSILFKK
jgi:FkbM family methyltransferase